MARPRRLKRVEKQLSTSLARSSVTSRAQAPDLSYWNTVHFGTDKEEDQLSYQTKLVVRWHEISRFQLTLTVFRWKEIVIHAFTCYSLYSLIPFLCGGKYRPDELICWWPRWATGSEAERSLLLREDSGTADGERQRWIPSLEQSISMFAC